MHACVWEWKRERKKERERQIEIDGEGETETEKERERGWEIHRERDRERDRERRGREREACFFFWSCSYIIPTWSRKTEFQSIFSSLSLFHFLFKRMCQTRLNEKELSKSQSGSGLEYKLYSELSLWHKFWWFTTFVDLKKMPKPWISLDCFFKRSGPTKSHIREHCCYNHDCSDSAT